VLGSAPAKGPPIPAPAIDTGTQPGYFFDKANPPLSSWDFATTWLQRSGDYPVLRWLANR
jgi:hypothetical protein